MKQAWYLITILLIFLIAASGAAVSKDSTNIDAYPKVCEPEMKPFFEPEKGFVPDAATAIRIAEAVWLPIYGDGIYSKKPFHAELRDSIWYVDGTLPEEWLGGVPHAVISMKNGCILNVYHSE